MDFMMSQFEKKFLEDINSYFSSIEERFSTLEKAIIDMHNSYLINYGEIQNAKVSLSTDLYYMKKRLQNYNSQIELRPEIKQKIFENQQLLDVLSRDIDYDNETFTDDEWKMLVDYNYYAVLKKHNDNIITVPENIVAKALEYQSNNRQTFNNNSRLIQTISEIEDKQGWYSEYNYCLKIAQVLEETAEEKRDLKCLGCGRRYPNCFKDHGTLYICNTKLYWGKKVYGCDWCLKCASIFMPHMRNELKIFCPYPELLNSQKLGALDDILSKCHPIVPDQPSDRHI